MPFNNNELIGSFEDKNTLDDFSLKVFFSAVKGNFISTQYGKDGGMYLNPNGTISRAEVFQALGTSDIVKDSIDGISKKDDFFNAGYNQIVTDEDSNFFSVYSRDDLFKPITRFELAYLLAHYENFDYADDFSYKGYLEKLYNLDDVKHLNLKLPLDEDLYDLVPKDYDTIDNYIYALCEGDEVFPLGLALLTINLAHLIGSERNLLPLKEVSRLDFALILNGLGLLNDDEDK